MFPREGRSGGVIVNLLTDGLAPCHGKWIAEWPEVHMGGCVVIKSAAGEFPITIERFEVHGRELVIVGKMGVWDARTHVGPRDFLGIVRKLFLSPAVLIYALKAPFAAGRQGSTG